MQVAMYLHRQIVWVAPSFKLTVTRLLIGLDLLNLHFLLAVQIFNTYNTLAKTTVIGC